MSYFSNIVRVTTKVLLVFFIVNVSYSYSGVLMHQAVVRNDIKHLELLVKQSKKEQLESRDEQGRTPLMLATELIRVDLAKILIDAGANVNAKDNKQDTPYLYAGAEGLLEILKMTLSHGAD